MVNRNAEELLKEVQKISKSNAGVQALADSDCCIMDKTYEPYPYKEDGRCPDFNRCDDSEYMLACLQSRNPLQLADWVIEKYYSAMDD